MIQLEDRLYTSTEVAEVLGVSLRSVYRYLEEAKLDAEIKTATGRHRFSKKNIMDFLYPNGVTAPRSMNETQFSTSTQNPVMQSKPVSQPVTHPSQQAEDVAVSPEPEQFASQTSVTQEEPQQPVEEPVDWLAKFREAAKKFREDSTEPAKPVETPAQEIKFTEQPAFAQEKFSGFTPVAQEPEREAVSTKVTFYKSSLGGLKDVAQSIDKSSGTANVPYAFTMNAGLSLYKPIKPFSVLHAYVKPQDLPFFERTLGLTQTEESTAQLCLLVSSDTAVFNEREQMHGLFVVSKRRLLDDIIKMGDSSLADEARSVL